MEIRRTVTFNVSEDEIRNFFDNDWWEETSEIGEDEFDALKDSLVDNNDYCDEEWTFVGDSKEVIAKIWQEEFERVKKPLAKERLETLKRQLAYFQKEMENNKQQIEKLKRAIKDAE